MTETTATRKPFYKNLDDTLEEVGITRRQLTYWRKAELFAPEFGPRTKYFTAQDISHLGTLKVLIDELGLPVGTVRALMDNSGRTGSPFQRQFINIEKKAFVDPDDVFMAVVGHLVGTRDTDALAERLCDLAFLLFRMMTAEKDPRVYEARRQELRDRISRMDLLARVEEFNAIFNAGAEPFWPPLSDDPPPSSLGVDGIESLESEQGDRLRRLGEAAKRAERMSVGGGS